MANSLKDMLGSVDWGKVLSNTDMRNAAIGAALGGTLLGGASLMQKRDPEESRFAPVGDALTGALLGGVAGYGIPKGLALFRDPGSLAPDGDTLKTNYLGWGAGGAAAGAGLFGASLYKTLGRAKDRLAARVAEERATVDRLLAAEFAKPQAQRRTDVLLDLIDRQRRLNPSAREAVRDIAGYRRAKLSALFHGDAAKYQRMKKELSEYKKTYNYATRGYSSLRGLLGEAASESPGVGKPRGLLRWLLSRLQRKGAAGAGPSLSHGAHYRPAALFGLFDKVRLGGRRISLTSPLVRVGARGLKYGLGGLALGLLGHKLIGPSASDNYRN